MRSSWPAARNSAEATLLVPCAACAMSSTMRARSARIDQLAERAALQGRLAEPKNFAKAGLASMSLPSPSANATPTGASRKRSPRVGGALMAPRRLSDLQARRRCDAASRGVNHQAVWLFDIGRTAATISMPGATAKDSSRCARLRPRRASGDRARRGRFARPAPVPAAGQLLQPPRQSSCGRPDCSRSPRRRRR